MGRQETNVELVRRGLAAFEAGDVEAALALVDPDVEIVTGAGLATPGVNRGHDGFARWNAEWMEAWASFETEAVVIEPVGERHVVVKMHQRATGKGSGIEVETDAGFMFEAAEGRAVAMHLYASFEEAEERAREREAAGRAEPG